MLAKFLKTTVPEYVTYNNYLANPELALRNVLNKWGFEWFCVTRREGESGGVLKNPECSVT
jgi:hypothetical protein